MKGTNLLQLILGLLSLLQGSVRGLSVSSGIGPGALCLGPACRMWPGAQCTRGGYGQVRDPARAGRGGYGQVREPARAGLFMKQTMSERAPSVYFRPAPFLTIVQGAIDMYTQGFALQRVGFYALLYTASDLLRDAERRNRLDGTTFKILQLSTALTAATALALEGTRGGPLSLKFKLPLAAILVQSVGAASAYGLPKINISLKLKNLLAMSFLATMVPATVLARTHLPAIIPLLLGALLALHGAATVGAKRLASTTYQKLNACLALFFIASAAATGNHAAALWGLPAVIGLWRGRTYKEEAKE